MPPAQQKQAAGLIARECCNYAGGDCLLLDDGEGHTCPQRISYSVCCRWFQNAVLPLIPELELEVFSGASHLRRCGVCGAVIAPRSNRGRYCPGCAAAVRRKKDRERKQKKRHAVRI